MNKSIIKTKIDRTIRVALIAFLLAGLILGGSPTAFAQGTVSGDKTLSSTDIQCDGSTEVTLTLNAQTGLAGDPEDIVLVLDRSGSMEDALPALQDAAIRFVDLIDEATDGVQDGVIAHGSRIGLVSFADSASLDVALTTDTNAVKDAINALTADGGTNHEAAFNTAQAQLAGSTNTKQMIFFTDGVTTVGDDASDEAAAAKAAGTEIFVIGLVGATGIDEAELQDWATDPDSEHFFETTNPEDLQAIFEAIGAAITVPAATNVVVVDTVNNHFSASGAVASKGNVAQVGNVLTWTIAELGTEIVTLTYTATHDNTKAGGVELVNDQVTYTDDAGLIVTFPNPTVNVRGCAAKLELTPATATNELGTPDQNHTVTAKVTDDFGDSVSDVTVNFEVIDGPNKDAVGSDTTDINGEATFTYTAVQGLAGLGTDTIKATAPQQANVSIELTDTATKDWVDTTPPDPDCLETVNPAGDNVPPAGSTTLPGAKGGQNEDGFYNLTAKDAVDPNPQIFVVDTGSGIEFGPFPNGTKIKYTQAPGTTPSINTIGGPNSAVAWHIKGTGDAAVYAVDAAGNKSPLESCLVPPPPK